MWVVYTLNVATAVVARRRPTTPCRWRRGPSASLPPRNVLFPNACPSPSTGHPSACTPPPSDRCRHPSPAHDTPGTPCGVHSSAHAAATTAIALVPTPTPLPGNPGDPAPLPKHGRPAPTASFSAPHSRRRTPPGLAHEEALPVRGFFGPGATSPARTPAPHSRLAAAPAPGRCRRRSRPPGSGPDPPPT